MLNWLVRYAPAAADIEIAGTSVLDVGCGSVGLSCVLPDARFAGQDIEFSQPVARGMFAVQTEPGRFPWADGAFDAVVCLDTLEHMPRGERVGFVAECARVAARRVLLSCPTDSGTDTDEFFARMYRSEGLEPPPWLYEHAEFGLPSVAEIEDACARVPGFTHTRWAQVNALLAALLAVGDIHLFFAADAVAEYRDSRPHWIAALQASRFGDGIRYGVELTRVKARAAVVDPQRFDETIGDALECGACGGPLRLDPAAALACGSCGRAATRGETGAYDVRTSALADAPRGTWLVRALRRGPH